MDLLSGILAYSRHVLDARVVLRNSIITSLGLFIRSGLQLVYFILVARSLGPTEYGSFGAAIALVAIFSPYSMLGAGNLLIKHASRNRAEFCPYWGSALAVVSIMGSLLTMVVVLTYRLLLPSSTQLWIIVLLCLSDLLFARYIDIAAQALQACEMIAQMNLIQTTLFAAKLISAVALLIPMVAHTAGTWAVLYFLSSLVSGTYAVAVVNRRLGRGAFDAMPILKEVKEGFYFSVGLSAASVYNDIDKTMMAMYSTLDATGVYVAAYRIVDAAMTPIRGLLTAVYTRFFVAGQLGTRGTVPIVKRLVPFGVSYGLVAIATILLGAGVVPFVLGDAYTATAATLRWLSPIILLRAVHSIVGDSLTGAGLQGVRTGVQGVVAVANVAMNIFLIPLYGLIGAIVSSLACDSLLLIMLSAVLVASRFVRRAT